MNGGRNVCLAKSGIQTVYGEYVSSVMKKDFCGGLVWSVGILTDSYITQDGLKTRVL